MRLNNENLLDDSGAVSLGADATLKPVWLGYVVNSAIQLVFTGSPTGTFKLQGSNDAGSITSAADAQQYSGVTNWTDVADSEFAVSAAGDVMWDMQNIGFAWVRVVYTRSSGTGSITVARAVTKGG